MYLLNRAFLIASLCTFLAPVLPLTGGQKGYDSPLLRPKLELALDKISASIDQVDLMHHEGEHLYILDKSSAKVYAVNETGSLAFIVGGHGQGPGEFQLAVSLFARDDSLFVMDEDDSSISVFNDEGVFLKKIPHGHFGRGRFYVNQHFQSTFNIPHYENPIKTIDFDGKVISTFGKDLKKPNGDGFNNTRYIFSNSRHLIAVPFYEPNIEYYSTKGVLLNEISLIHLPVIRKQYMQIQTRQQEHEGSYGSISISYYSDVIYQNDHLYLLAWTGHHTAVVMMLELGESRVKLRSQFEPALPEGYKRAMTPTTMCMNEKGELLIYDSGTRRIYLYSLDDQLN